MNYTAEQIMELVDNLCAYLPIEQKNYKDICDTHAELKIIATGYETMSKKLKEYERMAREYELRIK